MTAITTKAEARPVDTTDYFSSALATQAEIKELEERLKMLRGDLDYQIGKINELGLSSKIARVTGCRVIRKINADWVRKNRPDLYGRYAKVSASNVVSILGTLSGGERAVYDHLRTSFPSAFDDVAEITLGDISKDDLKQIDAAGGVDRITQATKKAWIELINNPDELTDGE